MAGSSSPSPVEAGQASQARPARSRLAYRGPAWLFGLVLAISLAVLVISLAAALSAGGRLPLAAEDAESNLALIVSTATSVVSLIGLLSTNLMAWRREARDAREAELDLQRQRLELEKLRLELEKSRNS